MFNNNISTINHNLEVCWNSYKNEIYHYCAKKLYASAYIEDCIQEIFYALLSNMNNGLKIENPKTWLYACARNICYKQNKKIKWMYDNFLYNYYDDYNNINSIKCYDNYFANEISEEKIEEIINNILCRLMPDECELLNDFYKCNYKLCKLSLKYCISSNALSHRLGRLKKKVYKIINERKINE